MYKLTPFTSILRRADGASIPPDTGNGDYRDYLAWVAEGNIPQPADVPDPKLAIQAQITQLEQEQLMPRATREFMLLFVETNNLTAMPGYAPLKAFDEQIKLLRNQLV